ncbi:galactose oxidase-like domain-containing protein [Reichenbachiella versicolor]|uniref:galactose oxidase-like domain-containing protein n=1 Tax=Reichenbachiella versicolor TaxID=1821036 RepID=UPI000D6E7643|nr:galactose oxidase-like domain-containing protein [Reichenbachiella versicolor]
MKPTTIHLIRIYFLFQFINPIFLSQAQHHHHKGVSNNIRFDMETYKRMLSMRKESVDADETEFGSWETVIPEINGAAVGRILGMQTVHNVLLPSGKILITSGSSWRNFKGIQYYPNHPEPAPAVGLFNMYNDPFRNSRYVNDTFPNYRKVNYYNLVNNTAIYDPVDNSFYRVPHPIPIDDPNDTTRFIPSDLFCSGHLQLPDGNPLFLGGTQYYFPYRTGTNSTFIFDWKKELEVDWKTVDWRVMPNENSPHYLWTFSGLMKRGRWYPSIVPLIDGRFVIFSGFVGFDKGFPAMYRFQINSYIEFFNPYEFSTQAPQKAWRAVDVQDKPESPFTTLINPNFEPTECTDLEFQTYWESISCKNEFPLPCDCNDACLRSNQYDAFKLYPNNYLVQPNKIYLTREGDWVSLRTSDAAYMRKTKKTYYMDVIGTDDKPDVSFSYGPDRPKNVTSYGTSYLDPNSKNITIIGGQPTSEGTLLPLDSKNPTHFAGGRGSRKKEEFWFNDGILKDQKWTMDDDFLGTELEDDRTMLTAIILPTKQVLIINGGNYDFYGAVFFPILLTPNYDSSGKFIDYERKRMSAAVEPRLYHNAALLLPNGKVWVSGGNSARASVSKVFPEPDDQNRKGQPKPDLSLVDVDIYFFNDGQMAKAQKGMQYAPTENWTAEIFSPPYIHIDDNRTVAIESIEKVSRGGRYEFMKNIGGSPFYLFKSNSEYELVLKDLPKEGSKLAEVVMIKLPSFTHNWNNGQHFVNIDIKKQSDNKVTIQTPNMQQELIPPGYYMLFYVDKKGKPSLAQMVRFDDKAVAP